MDYAPAERAPAPAASRDGLLPLKIVVAGGFGVGKTTFVAHASARCRRSTPKRG